ncbi:hypothetical protein BC940DRAFT_3219 [Gongronella butleri]|nr:hypothetical protein BC940DRAFT_3219 [Gongronella butleri]
MLAHHAPRQKASQRPQCQFHPGTSRIRADPFIFYPIPQHPRSPFMLLLIRLPSSLKTRRTTSPTRPIHVLTPFLWPFTNLRRLMPLASRVFSLLRNVRHFWTLHVSPARKTRREATGVLMPPIARNLTTTRRIGAPRTRSPCLIPCLKASTKN